MKQNVKKQRNGSIWNRLGILVFIIITLIGFSGTALYAGQPAENVAAYSLKSFQSYLFTGSASAGIPIDTLPGTGGLQPGLGLSYSSASVDELGVNQQPGWTGLGWGLSGVDNYIVKVGASDYKMVFQGASYDLVDSTGLDGAGGYFRTNPESYLKIKNEGSYWTVKTRDGAKYRFGYNIDSKFDNGRKRITLQQTLLPGWTAFSIPMSSVPSLEDYTKDTDVSVIWGYDRSNATDPWDLYDPEMPPSLNDLKSLEQGKYYAINIKNAPGMSYQQKSVSGIEADESKDFLIPIYKIAGITPSVNSFGNPFNRVIAISSLKVSYNSIMKNLQDAYSAGWLSSADIIDENTNVVTNSLVPWGAYRISTLVSATLIVPASGEYQWGAYQWNLDRVEDTDGNVMHYTYDRTQVQDVGPHYYTRSGRISKIEYSYRSGTPDTLAGNLREVIFNSVSDRTDFGDVHKADGFWDEKRLDRIEVKINSLPVRKYQFAQNYSSNYFTTTNFTNPDFSNGSTGWSLWNDSGHPSPSGAGGYLTMSLNGYAGGSWAKQTVKVPRNSADLRYRTSVDLSVGKFGGLYVLVDQGGKKYLVDHVKSTTDWVSRNVDLSPWAGKQVDIYFKAMNIDSTGMGSVSLDDVYLGTPALTLNSVTQWGSDGTAYSGKLPATTFSYNQNRLSAVKNGIGGSVSYTYETFTPRTEFTGVFANDQLRYRVKTSAANDGLSSTSTTTYSYTNDGGTSTDLYHTGDREFRGHGQVNVTAPAGSVAKYYYDQSDAQKGMLTKSETYGSNAKLYAKIENSISAKTTTNTIPSGDQLTNTTFEGNTLGWTTNYNGSGSASASTETKHNGGYSAKITAGGGSTTAGLVTLEQSKTLSTNVKYLSFWANLKQGPPGSGFKVYIKDGTSSYEVNSGINSSDWAEYRTDISAWAGKSVSIVFVAYQSFANSPEFIAFIDDISFLHKTPMISFPYVSDTKAYSYEGTATPLISRSAFTYDNYGNITDTVNYGQVDSAGNKVAGTYDKTQTKTTYINDTSDNILGLPCETIVSGYDISNAWVTQRHSKLYYDGLTTACPTTVSKGHLTKTDAYKDATNVVSTTMGYDGYGNLIWTKDANGNANSKGHTTDITYDSIYNAYPKTTRNAYDFVSIINYDTLMRPTEAIDINNISTYTEYDVFGRITAVRKYGDYAPNQPTVKTEYNDTADLANNKPVYVKTIVKDGRTTDTLGNGIKSYTFVDGLGRTIQTKSEGVGTNEWYTSESYYNAQGRLDRSGVPYTTTSTTPAVVSRKTTTTAGVWTVPSYDPIGRVWKVTKPDATFTQTNFGQWVIAAKDELGHQKKTYVDGLGMTTKVINYTGTSTYTSYATTSFKHNTGTGALVKLTDPAGNITATTFDLLGRKTKMVDPDMGTWSYAYDANGNMTLQTDARNKVIALSYDKLNRPTRKIYNSENSSNIRYFYDLGTYGKGRLYQVADLSGVSTYTYDRLGRITKNERLFDGISDGGFETGSYWSDERSSSFPASSVFRGNWGTAAPHTAGGNAKVASNQAYGSISSEYLASAASTTYTVSAYVRGSTDAAASEGNVVIRMEFYNSSKTYLGYKNAATIAPGSLTTTWTQKSGAVSYPDPTTAYMKVALLNYMNSGWAAFDDVAVSGRTLSNPGFETVFGSANWTTSISGSYPGTSIYRGNSGPSSTPHGGSNAVSISNLPYGTVYSPDKIPASAGNVFTVSAYVRGEWDSAGSVSPAGMIGVEYYNSSGTALCYTYVKGITSPTTAWTLYNGSTATPSFTSCAAPGNAPAGTAYARIILRARYFQGWIAFDDVALTKNGTAVALADSKFDTTAWTTVKDGNYPATGFWRGNWGIGDGHATVQDYSMVISNLNYTEITSTFVPVNPSTPYTFSAWMRGEAELANSGRNWLYVKYYDINKNPSKVNPDDNLAVTVTTTYAQKSLAFTTPSDAAYVKLELYTAFMRGWVAYDDITFTGGNAGKTYATQYTYDAAGRISTMTYPDNKEVVTYKYNKAGALGGTNPVQSNLYTSATPTYVQNMTYNTRGELASIKLGNGLTTTYSYHDNSTADPGNGMKYTYRLKSAVTGAVQSLTYGYYANGNVKTVTDNLISKYTATYAYDDLSRLITAETGTTVYGTLSYTYNNIDNLMTNGAGARTYTYPASGATSTRPHAVKSEGSNSYTYDNNGNMITKGARTFTWDSDNMLTSVTDTTGVKGAYFYDASGARTKKIEKGVTTYYVGGIYEEEWTGGVKRNITKYYSAGGTKIKRRLDAAGTTLTTYPQYIHGDRLGSSSRISNSSGALKYSIGYKPYGEDAYSNDLGAMDYRFTGKEKDDSTGLYYYGARYYDPALAKFISADPVEGPNRYAYVRNNPVNMTDPSGRSAVSCNENGICSGGYLGENDLPERLRKTLVEGMFMVGPIGGLIPTGKAAGVIRGADEAFTSKDWRVWRQFRRFEVENAGSSEKIVEKAVQKVAEEVPTKSVNRFYSLPKKERNAIAKMISANSDGTAYNPSDVVVTFDHDLIATMTKEEQIAYAKKIAAAVSKGEELK